MEFRKLLLPRTLISVSAAVLLITLVACGGTAAPGATGGDGSAGSGSSSGDASSGGATTDGGTGTDSGGTAAGPTPTFTPQPTRDLGATPTTVPTPVPDTGPAAWELEGQSKHYNGIFPMVGNSNPGFWDVHYGGSLNTTLMPSSPRFNQLVEYNPVNPTEIIGDLAETWDVNEDGTEFTFYLKDATWSDGMPVTADDIVFSLDRITLPGAQRARTGFLRSFYDHQTAEAIDDKTVRVPLKFPAPTFMPNLASDYMKMYPKHVAENLTQEEANQPESLIGSGPWLFGGWQKDVSYTFERNPTYFKEGRPFFDGIIVHLIPDTARRIAALQNGQVLGTFNPVTGVNRPEAMAILEEETGGQVRAVILPDSGFEAYFLNNAKPPFDDERVRRAFYLALDRDLGIERAVRSFGTPGTYFAPGVVENLADLRANNPAFKEDRSEAIAEAKSLLEAAGYPDGVTVRMNTRNAIPTLPAAEVASAQLRRDVGIDIEIVPNDLATTYAVMRDGTYEISTVGTGIILRDPADILNQFYLQDVLRNPQNWQDSEIDDLIDLQNRSVDQQVRQGYLEDIADVLHTGKSHLVVYFWSSNAGAFDYRMRNFYLPPTLQQVHKWDHVWFDEDRVQPAESGYQP